MSVEASELLICLDCGSEYIKSLLRDQDMKKCPIPGCGAVLQLGDQPHPTPPREHMPGDGRLQRPRRNEEKRPL